MFLRTALALVPLLALLPARPAGAATYCVAQQDARASDASAGTEARPLKTLGAAMAKVHPGDTVTVKNGTYRESVAAGSKEWNDPERHTTLTAHPGHRPVIKGSDVWVARWERLPGDRPIYSCARDAYTQMVFVDEQPLTQVGLVGNPGRQKRTDFRWAKQWHGKGLADMAAGTFFYDAEAKRLYAWLADGGNPQKHVVEVAVRPTALSLTGTWTLRGIQVRHVMDGLWPNEQAVAVSGNHCVVEKCRITHNEFVGLIVSGEDGIIRGNEIAYNGLMGFTSNIGYRMLVEENDFHHNATRGDVVCLTAGNKWVCWRDSKFLRNRFHDEEWTALWLDISNANILVAENLFERCNVGLYWEISRWAVVANNVFRRCGRACWIYSADTLVAHNVFEECGEGILISGFERTCDALQSTREPSQPALMATRNNLAVNNLLIDCPGAYVGINEESGHGAGNASDYNAFVWTYPAYHRTGLHINFMSGWNSLYARLPEWRYLRHQDEHSVVADPGLLRQVENEWPWVALSRNDVVGDAGLVDRARGDYRLKPDSPLATRGVVLPDVLNSGYRSAPGNGCGARQWERTALAGAPAGARTVYGGAGGHYRLQPLPAFHRLADLDTRPAGPIGLNREWARTGRYPQFDTNLAVDTAGPADWVVFPRNRLDDSSFEKPMAKAGSGAAGPWFVRGDLSTYMAIACANLFPTHQANVLAFQKVGTLAPNCEYILWGDLSVRSVHPQLAGIGEIYLAVGEGLAPVGAKASLRADPGKERSWNTCDTRYHSPAAGDPTVGKDLYVVIAARVQGPADVKSTAPVVFVRWDNLTLLSGDGR